MKKYFQISLAMVLFILFIANSSFVSLDNQNQALEEFQTSDQLISNMSLLSMGDNNCIGCHLHLEYNANPVLNAVHEPTNTNHRSAIIGFINTHNSFQAAEKNVDLDKVTVYLENMSN